MGPALENFLVKTSGLIYGLEDTGAVSAEQQYRIVRSDVRLATQMPVAITLAGHPADELREQLPESLQGVVVFDGVFTITTRALDWVLNAAYERLVSASA